MRRQSAFTLIEVLVAMAIFGIMSALAYMTLAQTLDNSGMLSERMDRLQAVQRTMNYLSTELLQATPRPIRADLGQYEPALRSNFTGDFALEVTHPQAGNIGGGGFLVFMDAKNSTTTFDFREKAPLLATADMFLDSKGNLVKGSNHNGLKSVGVPGTVAGLYLAHQKYGKLPYFTGIKKYRCD